MKSMQDDYSKPTENALKKKMEFNLDNMRYKGALGKKLSYPLSYKQKIR